MKLRWNEKKKDWDEIKGYEKGKDIIALDGFLRTKLDNVLRIQRRDWDCVILIDGIEGSGKSTLSFIIGWYLTQGRLTLNNVCEGSSDAKDKLEKLPNKSILIIDEGSLIFSSKETTRREQTEIVKVINVIRQKKMVLIVVAPSFFDLNKYISVGRSRFLLHVYTKKNMERGRFAYFSERKKRMLYEIGKKNYNSYNKPKSNFVGSFSSFDPFGEAYQALKRKSLMDALKDSSKPKVNQVNQFKIKFARAIVGGLPLKTKKDVYNALNIDKITLYNWEKGLIGV